MLNFRKLKQDYSPSMLKDGKALYDKQSVVSAKIIKLGARSVRLSCRVKGSFDNTYECDLEIDTQQSITSDGDCDCPYKYDCQHLASVLFYLEEHFDSIMVAYAKESDLDSGQVLDPKEKKKLRETIKAAETKEVVKRGKKNQKELLEEYINAGALLGQSPFFLQSEEFVLDRAELALVCNFNSSLEQSVVEVQLALRLPFRSKPLNVPNLKEFVESVRYGEPIYMSSRRFYFTIDSFPQESAVILKMLINHARFPEAKEEKTARSAWIDTELFGALLAKAHDLIVARSVPAIAQPCTETAEYLALPCLHIGSLEEPLRYSNSPVNLSFELEYLEVPEPKILMNPTILFDQQTAKLEEVRFFEGAQPGAIYKNVYYRFSPNIKRKHLKTLHAIRDVTIPEPLFGTFVENALPELMHFAKVSNEEVMERFVTLPFTGNLEAECDIHYLNGELEASLSFIYDGIKVPAANSKLTINHILPFVTSHGVLARNLTEEQRILNDLFQGFVFDPAQGIYIAKSDKKIVEFMTEVIPQNQKRVKFNCPENLLDQFIYDNSKFKLTIRESQRVDVFEADLEVDGHLHGVTVDLLWECLSAKRAYIELPGQKGSKSPKILVLDLDRLAPVVQIFDEMGIKVLSTHQEERPLWVLTTIDPEQFETLPIEFSMSDRLKALQKQMLGSAEFNSGEVPAVIQASLRPYQIEGVNWLERLRHMHLNGVLADDMGLGKTLQAIIAMTQHKIALPDAIFIVVCPTSLVYNWKEEISKFNPELRVLPVDGTPSQRKKLINDIKKYDVVITSYSLLQKDIEFYKSIPFDYAILDEAQHIKNRGTHNARSVKLIQARHRVILTGTPIENSLDELWSLFDFLMPGLLSTYDRFLEKYIRNPNQPTGKNLEALRKKVAPFILRRMKKDVLHDLPPVSEIIYHCNLSEKQRELYHSYAASAREELAQLVKKEGFDRVQIHVLATLTRLKQICCHPAIFAKEMPEEGDSSKYEMLMELLQTLMEGKHKTVIFSQYTRMLRIMQEDLRRRGISFEYLDGSSKNRLGIVKKFNEDQNIPIFLVSLKAGGTGLNLVGADTVIHYDMWWNPAVENQATDRVHRIGQKCQVSSYRLITLNTIEEKILELQNRKRELVQKVVSCDEDVIARLTWEEVLELLQT